MADSTIEKLMKKHGFNNADISFIINYMAKEKLSPQLIMRRIKSYEALEKKLKTKLDADKKKVEHLEKELEIKTKTLEEANKKLEELGQAIQQEDEIRASLETRSEILDAELEELRNQLQMIQVMQVDEPAQKSPEAEEITKSVNHIINEIKLVIVEYEEVTTLFLPIVTALTEALANPEEFVFNSEDLVNAVEDFIALMKLDSEAKPYEQVPTEQTSAPLTAPVKQPEPTSTVPSPVPPPIASPPTSSPAPTQPSSKLDSPSPTAVPSPVSVSAPPSKSDTPQTTVPPPVSAAATSGKPDIPSSEDTEEQEEVKIAPTWKKIEKDPELEPEKPIVNPKDAIQKTQEQFSTDKEDTDSTGQTTRHLTPSEIIKQRQRALAEREAKRAAELAEIERLKQAALKKVADADKKEADTPLKEEVKQEEKVEPVDEKIPPSHSTVSQAEKTGTATPVTVTSSPRNTGSKVKEEESKKETKTKQPERQKTDDKTTLVLRTFQDFINEAKTTKNFNERIKLICDQDAAYEVLGSIGVSQLYSYITRPIEMKKEVIDLIESWIKNGTP